MRPRLFSFDIFGTVVDWRRGLREAVGAIDDASFDRIIDWQGGEEQRAFRSYREIVAGSLVEVLGLDRAAADRVGREAGRWPLFPDSREGLRRLMKIAPCVAMTNSDREHGEQVQEALGFRLSRWLCAEEVRAYKPSPDFWRAVGEKPGPDWWHVSAYADYDLEPAARLGLTTVFLPRTHARPGVATHSFRDLEALAAELVHSRKG